MKPLDVHGCCFSLLPVWQAGKQAGQHSKTKGKWVCEQKKNWARTNSIGLAGNFKPKKQVVHQIWCEGTLLWHGHKQLFHKPRQNVPIDAQLDGSALQLHQERRWKHSWKKLCVEG